MKSIILSFVLLCAVSFASASLKCEEKPADIPKEWLDMSNGCINEVKRQIQAEMDAAMIYLAMGAHFSKDTVNRPGFAKFFFESASEEREHGSKLIEYLLMRGPLSGVNNEITNLIKVTTPEKTSWKSGVEALKDALRTEAKVTKSIRKVIDRCEDDNGNNDYHFVDFLTGVYLEEQYAGQRALAGKISTLDKMMASHGAIGEFLYDKKMLE